MSKGLERARAELVRAEADAEKWARAVADAEAAVAEAERADVDDPADLDDVGQAAARAHANAGAARRALSRALARLAEARCLPLLAEADDEDDAARAAEKTAAAHRAKVDALLSQLRTLEGVTYSPGTEDDRKPLAPGEDSRRVDTPRGVLLEREAWRHRVRAGVLRHVAEHERMPNGREWDALGLVSWLEDPHAAGVVPESVAGFLATVAAA